MVTRICVTCHSVFTARTNHSKYCTECREKKRRHSLGNRYKSKRYDQINVTLPRGEREGLKRYAKAAGMSLNHFLLSAAKEYQENHPITEN